jgi:hypothetical protein
MNTKITIGALLVLAAASATSAQTTFKTITLGTYPSVAALENALGDLSLRATSMMEKVSVSRARTQVDLVTVSVRELGFRAGATLEAIVESGKRLGLEVCPAEVGPQLRLQYPNQPESDSLLIAMEPIVATPLVDGVPVPNVRPRPAIFSVSGTSGGSLFASVVESSYDPATRWVFVRRK